MININDLAVKFWLDVAQKINIQKLFLFWHDKTVKLGKTIKDFIRLFRQFVFIIFLDALNGNQPRLKVN